MKEEKQPAEASALKDKKEYTKPVINQIRLVAEEAVLALCKWGTGASGRSACRPDTNCVSTRRS